MSQSYFVLGSSYFFRGDFTFGHDMEGMALLTAQFSKCFCILVVKLRRMGTDREIVRQFKTRKLQYLGHIIRHNSSQLLLIEGNIEGRRSRGRPRNTWSADITTTKGIKYYQLKRAAEDRRRWHGLVVNLAQETTLR